MGLYFFVFYFNAYFLVPTLYLRQQYALYFLVVGLMLAGVVFVEPFDHLIHMGADRMDSPPPRPMPPAPGLAARPAGRGSI